MMTMPSNNATPPADPTLAALEALLAEFHAFRAELEQRPAAQPAGTPGETVAVPKWVFNVVGSLIIAAVLALFALTFDVRDLMATRYTRDDANADNRRNEEVHGALGSRLQRLEQIHDMRGN